MNEREYENEVYYEVWRMGGNPDGVNYDRVSDGYYCGRDADETAARELRHQRSRRQEEEMECQRELEYEREQYDAMMMQEGEKP
ncbi:MAG: hypothetical protein PHE61_08845 [Candidatus Omnitrophica bacterium]|nr:hypothetical protein [Candidatus Omnitrophota bacterium]